MVIIDSVTEFLLDFLSAATIALRVLSELAEVLELSSISDCFFLNFSDMLTRL